MNAEERQAFFDLNGYWPMVERPRPIEVPTGNTQDRAKRALGHLANLRGWRAPLHWAVPPAFERPGFIYEVLGHEQFCEAVKSYYEAIGALKQEQAIFNHTKWAIRACLRAFETHRRGFRGQHVSRRGGVFPYSSGQEYYRDSGDYVDITTPPETLVKDGRLVADLKGWLDVYGVPKDNQEVACRFVKHKLQQLYKVAV